MNMLAGIFLTIIGLSVTLSTQDSASSQDEECGGTLSTLPHSNITQLISYYSRCTFPTQKLKMECVLSSCPSLKQVCPLSSAGAVDEKALTSAVSILNNCIAQNSLICGINMTRIPNVQIGWTTSQLLPANVVNGTIWVIPGTGYLRNLSGATFSLPQMANKSGPISVLIQVPNIIIAASHNCTFDVDPLSFLSPIFNVINVPDMICTFHLNLSSTVSIDLSNPAPANINISDDKSEMRVEFTNFVGQLGMELPSEMVNKFNEAMDEFVQGSDIPSFATNFLATYVALAFQGAQLNCP